MNKILALSLAAVVATTMTGCLAEGGYARGSYGSPYARSYTRSYVDVDDYGPYSYGSYGYGGPRYVQDVIYIDGRPCRHDSDRDRYYYTSGSNRVYITDDQYSRNRDAINRWKSQQRQKEAEYKYSYAQNKQKLEYQKKQNEWNEREARYKYEQEKKQYQYQQKVASNQAELDKARYKQGLETQKKQWEYQQKQNELKQRQAVAEWKYKNGVRSDDDDKKKKKKN
jgi:hypothetical protein